MWETELCEWHPPVISRDGGYPTGKRWFLYMHVVPRLEPFQILSVFDRPLSRWSLWINRGLYSGRKWITEESLVKLVFDSTHKFVETWCTRTVHVRCVYSEGSRFVSRLVKINFWGKPFREWVKFCNPRVAVECKFSNFFCPPKISQITSVSPYSEIKCKGKRLKWPEKRSFYCHKRWFSKQSVV